jgi:hypothetical protein
MGRQQGCRHDRTVGEADSHGPSGEVVAGAGCFDEFRQHRRFGLNVSLIHLLRSSLVRPPKLLFSDIPILRP